jgi:histone H3/H4
MADLPNAAVKRILLASGVPRISATAVSMAADAAQQFLQQLARAAVENSNNAKRRTVMDDDVAAARERLLRAW